MDSEDWTDKTALESMMLGPLSCDSEPDEFIINACGLSASIWFYRDNTGQIKSKIKNNNGVPFTIKPPVIPGSGGTTIRRREFRPRRPGGGR